MWFGESADHEVLSLGEGLRRIEAWGVSPSA